LKELIDMNKELIWEKVFIDAIIIDCELRE
jgi:hypothetical protein